MFYILKQKLSLLRICGNYVCESCHHLDSLLSNVIHYFRISDIFHGLVVTFTPRHVATGCKSHSDTVSRVSSRRELSGSAIGNTGFPCLKLSGFSVACSLAAISCFSLSLSMLLRSVSATSSCTR